MNFSSAFSFIEFRQNTTFNFFSKLDTKSQTKDQVKSFHKLEMEEKKDFRNKEEIKRERNNLL